MAGADGSGMGDDDSDGTGDVVWLSDVAWDTSGDADGFGSLDAVPAL